MTLSARLLFPLPLDGVPPRLEPDGVPPETNSMESLCPVAFFSSSALRISCWLFKSSSLYPHAGNADGFQISRGRDVAYCPCSSIPTCCRSFVRRLGFFRDDDEANFSLKWIPCFFKSRKWANFLFATGSGDPGGEGGMSRLGTGGSVRSWMRARVVENGEDCLERGRSGGGLGAL